MRLIDADALKALIIRRRKEAKTLTGIDMVMVIDDAPTVDAAPVKHGRWETDLTEQNEFWGHYCSRCSTYLPYGRDWKPNYCPECGVKMDLEGLDEKQT